MPGLLDAKHCYMLPAGHTVAAMRVSCCAGTPLQQLPPVTQVLGCIRDLRPDLAGPLAEAPRHELHKLNHGTLL